jgi:hypothetical protein
LTSCRLRRDSGTSGIVAGGGAPATRGRQQGLCRSGGGVAEAQQVQQTESAWLGSTERDITLSELHSNAVTGRSDLPRR